MYPLNVQPLSYAINALEPYITAQMMEFHYGKHYVSYIENFNRVLADQSALQQQSLEQLLTDAQNLDTRVRQQIINFGGGVYNHELFWSILGKKRDQKPTGKLAERIVRDFGSFEKFQQQLTTVSTSWFGSGWGWLCVDNTRVANTRVDNTRVDNVGKLVVLSMGNQDCPLSQGLYPLMNIDVWEHAYYLQYQNRRAEFIAACWQVINWKAVEKRYELFS